MQDFNEVINNVIEDVENIENIQRVIDIMEAYYNELIEFGTGNEEDVISALEEIGEYQVINNWIAPQKPKKETWEKRLPLILKDLTHDENKREVEDIILELDSEFNLEGLDYIKEAKENLIAIGENKIADKWLKNNISYVAKRKGKKIVY